MAEPTLSLGLSLIQAKLGRFAGWGRGTVYSEPAWTTQQASIISDAMDSGLRMFYYPEPDAYDWSFLHPQTTIALASGNSTVTLPDDFGGAEGKVNLYTIGSEGQITEIDWENEGAIRERYAEDPDETGPPQYIAVIPGAAPGSSTGQRFKFYLFPAADQNYTLQYTYYINPNTLSSGMAYPYGGQEHSETILEACLAAMEAYLDDTMQVHAIRFKERLAASVAMDRKKKAQRIGYNGDRSDNIYGRTDSHWLTPAATYNGASYD